MQTQATLQAVKADVTNNKVRGIANSLTTTRSGIQVTQDAGKQVIGKKVPLLLSHNWESMPIGEATMTAVSDDGLEYEGAIFESVPEKQQILDGITAGVLSVSIGFGVDDIDEHGVINKIDLLELSVTPVPADPKATITQGLTFIKEDITMDKEEVKQDVEQEAVATIDEVITAINGLSDKIDEVLKAVAPADDKQPDDDAPADDTATQSVNELVKVVQGLEINDVMTSHKVAKLLSQINLTD